MNGIGRAGSRPGAPVKQTAGQAATVAPLHDEALSPPCGLLHVPGTDRYITGFIHVMGDLGAVLAPIPDRASRP